MEGEYGEITIAGLWHRCPLFQHHKTVTRHPEDYWDVIPFLSLFFFFFLRTLQWSYLTFDNNPTILSFERLFVRSPHSDLSEELGDSARRGILYLVNDEVLWNVSFKGLLNWTSVVVDILSYAKFECRKPIIHLTVFDSRTRASLHDCFDPLPPQQQQQQQQQHARRPEKSTARTL